MRKTMYRLISYLCIFAMFVSLLPISAFAADPFSIIEVFGNAGRTYITTKSNVPLRASPANTGAILEKLPQNFPVEAEGLYRTRKNTLWIKVKMDECAEAWIYTGNVQLHSCSYIELDEYGVAFCKKCGHIQAMRPDANLVDLDSFHIVLAAASMLPVIGNGFDLLDGMISLAEGDYVSATLSIASAVPVFGSIGNTLKVTDDTIEIFDTAADVVTATRVGSNTVEVSVRTNSRILGKNMDALYQTTFDDRFYNYKDYILDKRSIAAHHIVAGGAKDINARNARGLLNYLDIGINSAENGVYLCMRSDSCLEGVIHATKHSPEYYRSVNQRLLKAFNSVNLPMSASAEAIKEAQREAVLEALDSIARDLMSGKFKL